MAPHEPNEKRDDMQRAVGRRSRRQIVAPLALAAVMLGGLLLPRAPADAQPTTEQHSGEFSLARAATGAAATLCWIPLFPYSTGTLEFTINRATGSVEGRLEGKGAVGYRDGQVPTFPVEVFPPPPPGEPAFVDQPWSFVSAYCNRESPEGGVRPMEVRYTYRGTITAALQGTWNRETGEIVLLGTADIRVETTFYVCQQTQGIRPVFRGRCAELESRFRDAGGSSKVTLEFRGVRRAPESAEREGGTAFAGGSIEVFGHAPDRPLEDQPRVPLGRLTDNVVFARTLASWQTRADVPAPPSPSPTATPTPAPTPGPPSPAPPPGTVCTDCPDAEWAAQTAESWAQGMLAAPSVCPRGGGTCGPANPSVVATAMEQYRTCLLGELRGGASRTDARARCFNMLPIGIPLG